MMIGLLISVLIVLLIITVLWYIMGALPLPPPIAQIARAIVLILFLIWIIYLLTPYAAHPLIR